MFDIIIVFLLRKKVMIVLIDDDNVRLIKKWCVFVFDWMAAC